MAKTHQETQFLISSEGSGSVYAHRKNRKKFKGDKKLSLRKYDPVLRKHVVFDESSKLRSKEKIKAKAAGKAEAVKASEKAGAAKAAAPKATKAAAPKAAAKA